MKSTLLAGLACAAVVLFNGVARAADPPPKTVVLQRLINEIPQGEQRIVIRGSIGCFEVLSSKTYATTGDVSVAPYLDGFRKAFTEAGLHPQGEPNLFEANNDAGAEYALAGVVKAESYKLCEPNFTGIGPTDLNGDGTITIEWQLYSRLENRIVARARIVSGFHSTATIPGGPLAFENRTIFENFKLLAADSGIRDALAGPGSAKDEIVKPASLPPIVLEGVRAIAPRSIDQASRSVVVIYAGDALGSGVLISKDGYILTDAHVVGDAATVRLRWSDGKEGVATVLRSSKARDVALIKADATGHEPLPLSINAPDVGSTVYAVGSPEGDAFQGTLTRGVVSAMRPMNGLNYIQSDVTTGHGGSGGPLLDDKGYVVGLTDLGVGHEATSSGLNFFTPIKDAIAFLNLDLR